MCTRGTSVRYCSVHTAVYTRVPTSTYSCRYQITKYVDPLTSRECPHRIWILQHRATSLKVCVHTQLIHTTAVVYSAVPRLLFNKNNLNAVLNNLARAAAAAVAATATTVLTWAHAGARARARVYYCISGGIIIITIVSQQRAHVKTARFARLRVCACARC